MNQQILTITENVPVTKTVYRMRLEGADLEQQKPGGFVNIRLDGLFLRRPISVYDSEPGSLTILYKTVGKGTEQMSGMKPGETLDVLVPAGEAAAGGGEDRPSGARLQHGGGDFRRGSVPGAGLRRDGGHRGRELRDEGFRD